MSFRNLEIKKKDIKTVFILQVYPL